MASEFEKPGTITRRRRWTYIQSAKAKYRCVAVASRNDSMQQPLYAETEKTGRHRYATAFERRAEQALQSHSTGSVTSCHQRQSRRRQLAAVVAVGTCGEGQLRQRSRSLITGVRSIPVSPGANFRLCCAFNLQKYSYLRARRLFLHHHHAVK